VVDQEVNRARAVWKTARASPLYRRQQRETLSQSKQTKNKIKGKNIPHSFCHHTLLMILKIEPGLYGAGEGDAEVGSSSSRPAWST